MNASPIVPQDYGHPDDRQNGSRRSYREQRQPDGTILDPELKEVPTLQTGDEPEPHGDGEDTGGSDLPSETEPDSTSGLEQNE